MTAASLLSGLAGFGGPLLVALLVQRLARLPGDPQLWLRFAGGAATAFVALICERFVFHYFRPSLPSDWLIAAEAFLFVGLPEEIAKLSLIYGAMIAVPRTADFRTFAFVGLLVGAGFAGTENVLYTLHADADPSTILITRMLTAVPFHLSNAIIATFLLCKAREDERATIFIGLALVISILLHGLYDYLLMTDQVGSGKFLFALILTLSLAVRLLRRSATAGPAWPG